MKQITATVVANKRILPGGPHRAGWSLGSHLIKLHCPEMERAKPGQFVMVNCGGECVLPRPFSLHWANRDDIALFFAALERGKGTQWLANRKEGDAVKLFGPLGNNGFSISPRAKRLLVVAGGNGIAPLCFLAQQAVSGKCSVTLLLGAAVGPLYTERPENLLPQEIALVTATEDGSSGHKGLITDLLPDYVDWADQIFACGPASMYRVMAQMPKLKNKPVQVSLEVRMGCGRGVCYGCTVKTKQGLKQVCQDGPVFDLDDVIWEELDY